MKLFKRYFSIQKNPLILFTQENNIYFNLATQQTYFLSNLQKPILFLWRNQKTVVIGKHQNPFQQCNLHKMKQHGVVLSRRKSGGGAVYHDLGNVCFSFLTPFDKDENIDFKKTNNQIIINSLSNLGIKALQQGRNDIQVEGRKISGSAYKIQIGDDKKKSRKALHHGTVLFNVNQSILLQILNPPKSKLTSKGISSIKSRVMNLNQNYPDLTIQSFYKEMEKNFIKKYGQCTIKYLSLENVEQDNQIKKLHQFYKSWDWLYGQTPQFTNKFQHKFTWAYIEINLLVKDGVVQSVKIFSDCLYPQFIQQLNQKLQNIKYDLQGFQNAFNKVKLILTQLHYESMLKDLFQLIQKQI